MNSIPPPTDLRHSDMHQDHAVMVHNAASEWPRLSPRVRELFRRGAEIALSPQTEWVEAIRALPAHMTSNESEDG